MKRKFDSIDDFMGLIIFICCVGLVVYLLGWVLVFD